MTDEPRVVRIDTHCERAIWPGGEAICVRVSAPKYFKPLYYLGHRRTGTVSILEPYRYGMLRGRR